MLLYEGTPTVATVAAAGGIVTTAVIDCKLRGRVTAAVTPVCSKYHRRESYSWGWVWSNFQVLLLITIFVLDNIGPYLLHLWTAVYGWNVLPHTALVVAFLVEAGVHLSVHCTPPDTAAVVGLCR